MAARCCMSTALSALSVASRTEQWPAVAARANPEAAVNSPSSANCSPSRNYFNCDRKYDTRSLRWSSCGLLNLRKRELGLRLNASFVGQGGPDAQTVTDSTEQQLVEAPRKAADIVQEFYDLINARDYIGVANLFAEDCEYDDFNYSKPTRGREEILKFFEKVMSSFGTEMKFVIDDMTRDDPNAVGVIWHLDWRGKSFPFSRGCSFYRCEVNRAGEQQIKYARDIVEPATKPGNVSMGALRLVTSLFERFPQLADRL